MSSPTQGNWASGQRLGPAAGAHGRAPTRGRERGEQQARRTRRRIRRVADRAGDQRVLDDRLRLRRVPAPCRPTAAPSASPASTRRRRCCRARPRQIASPSLPTCASADMQFLREDDEFPTSSGGFNSFSLRGRHRPRRRRGEAGRFARPGAPVVIQVRGAAGALRPRRDEDRLAPARRRSPSPSPLDRPLCEPGALEGSPARAWADAGERIRTPAGPSTIPTSTRCARAMTPAAARLGTASRAPGEQPVE